MICKHCGAQIPDNSAFCTNCGSTVENENAQTRPMNYAGYETKKSGINTTLIVIIIVIVTAILGGVVAFFIFRDNFIPEKKDDPQYTVTENSGSAEATAAPTNTPTPTPNPTVPPVPTTPPAQSTRSEVNTNPGNNEYMYASNIKVLSQSDLSSLTQAETRLLLNEIYARHGYIFQTREYSDYFSRKAWYTPRYTSQSDAESQFNDIELQNKNIISNYEKSRGWR